MIYIDYGQGGDFNLDFNLDFLVFPDMPYTLEIPKTYNTEG